METTHLGLALPNVLQQLKEMLTRQGFIVQIMPTPNPVLVASQKGNWLRRSKQFILEISSVQKNITKVDITAVLDDNNNDLHAEEILEENFVSALYNTFKKVIQPPHGT